MTTSHEFTHDVCTTYPDVYPVDLYAAPRLGLKEVTHSLEQAPWLLPYLDCRWLVEGCDEDRAFGAAVRLLLTSIVLRTSRPEDLVHALTLPRAVVSGIMGCLASIPAHAELQAEINDAISADVDLDTIDTLLTDYAIGRFSERTVAPLDVIQSLEPLLTGGPSSSL